MVALDRPCTILQEFPDIVTSRTTVVRWLYGVLGWS